MASTGTFLFDPNLAIICDEAVERSGLNLQDITAYDHDTLAAISATTMGNVAFPITALRLQSNAVWLLLAYIKQA